MTVKPDNNNQVGELETPNLSHGYAVVNGFSGISLYAGFWERVVAYFIDEVILGIIRFSITFSLYAFFGTNSIRLKIILLVFPFIISWAYYTLQESGSMMATFGKRAVKIVVVNEDMDRISFIQASIRWLIKAIPVINLISFLYIVIDEKKQGLHDKAAKTYVVNREKIA